MLGLLKKINKNSIYYTLFEGLSRGGSHLLLIIIASVISDDLYVQMILLISVESLITMLFLSYGSNVLYGLNRNKLDRYFSYAFDTSFVQIVFFIILYISFKTHIDSYFNYDLSYVIIFLILNASFTNIIRFYSVSHQIDLKHTLAIKYKSIPFFISFLISILFFLVLEDKVFGFFFGKTVGLTLFVGYLSYKENVLSVLFKTDKQSFLFVFKRSKYSIIVAILNWATGLGFINFVKIYSNGQSSIVLLGLVMNFMAVLLLISSGINQVYMPQLRRLFAYSLDRAVNYSRYIHKVYFFISFLIVLLIVLIYYSKGIYTLLPDSIKILVDSGYVLIIPALFFVYTFNWVSNPYFMIKDEFRKYFNTSFAVQIAGWIVVFIMIILDFDDFIIMFFTIKVIISLGIYISVINLLDRRIL